MELENRFKSNIKKLWEVFKFLNSELDFFDQFLTIQLIIMRYRNINQKMHMTNLRLPIFKFAWLLIRLIINLSIFASIFLEPGFTDQLCGPLAMPAVPKLMERVFLIEIAYSIWPLIFVFMLRINPNSYTWRKLVQLKWPKMLFILILKLTIILSQSQRLKYYMHVFFIQFTIFVFTAVFDLIGQQSVCEGWQIVMTDSFQRIAILYQVTRTFCPNLAIYWFFSNLLLLCLSQIQSHVFYSSVPKSDKMEPIYPLALYVKQDIYRIMIMTFIYFGLFSFLQTSTLGYGMLICFCISAAPFIYSIRKIQQGKFTHSLFSLIAVCVIIAFFVHFRYMNPTFFKIFGIKQNYMCGIFDKQ